MGTIVIRDMPSLARSHEDEETGALMRFTLLPNQGQEIVAANGVSLDGFQTPSSV